MSHAAEAAVVVRRNRISTTEVADALGKRGVLDGVQPVTPELHVAGVIRTVYASDGSNYGVHAGVRDVQEDEVVVVFTDACERRAILGDLIAKYTLLYRGAAAVVVQGLVRDAGRLRRERYPIWSEGFTPLGCVNVPGAPFPAEQESLLRARYDGGLGICDDGGVVLVPAADTGPELIDRLQRIELQEDVWYYCLDTLKWDTLKIVCEKGYLRESGVLPSGYEQALERLGQPFTPFGEV
jgi:regulator of RNase E activity RraA